MSTHVISSGVVPDWQHVRSVIRLARREPTAVIETDAVTEGTGEDARLISSTVSLVFDPDLTPEEQMEFDALLSAVQGLPLFQGLILPTLDQTNEAVKGLTRIVDALLRE